MRKNSNRYRKIGWIARFQLGLSLKIDFLSYFSSLSIYSSCWSSTSCAISAFFSFNHSYSHLVVLLCFVHLFGDLISMFLPFSGILSASSLVHGFISTLSSLTPLSIPLSLSLSAFLSWSFWITLFISDQWISLFWLISLFLCLSLLFLSLFRHDPSLFLTMKAYLTSWPTRARPRLRKKRSKASHGDVSCVERLATLKRNARIRTCGRKRQGHTKRKKTRRRMRMKRRRNEHKRKRRNKSPPLSHFLIVNLRRQPSCPRNPERERRQMLTRSDRRRLAWRVLLKEHDNGDKWFE